MKKIYLKPKMSVYEIQQHDLIATSDPIIPGGEEVPGGGDGNGKDIG